MTSPRTTLKDGHYAPLPHRSSAAPHSTLPHRSPLCFFGAICGSKPIISLKGQTGDALHAVLCATGYNLRWLLRAIVRLGLGPIFFILAWLHWIVNVPLHPPLAHRALPAA
ncbi:hypothetical protein DEE50_29635 [Burkholderia cepacia]|nr:hypothetical protein [Burkholderia cepacia]MBX3925803.1 hypothetical protein [Burkholderia cepacia]MBX3939880.1 hypothetical protein [Burkholderia cepacia]MBX3958078.1 hypothetical protein [Burkholderia cepacia]MBX3978682.1 hypothetical protein [Burkholderia cepacia]